MNSKVDVNILISMYRKKKLSIDKSKYFIRSKISITNKRFWRTKKMFN
jgi:hypothetical protein